MKRVMLSLLDIYLICYIVVSVFRPT